MARHTVDLNEYKHTIRNCILGFRLIYSNLFDLMLEHRELANALSRELQRMLVFVERMEKILDVRCDDEKI